MPKRKLTTTTPSTTTEEEEEEVKKQQNEEQEDDKVPDPKTKKIKTDDKKQRLEDCDAYWKDDGGDTITKEDEESRDFKWPAKDAEKQIKIVSWNVAGFRSVLKKGFESYVAQEDPDILCLQETKIAEKVAGSAEFKKVLPGYHRYFFECKSNAGHHGTAIFTKKEPLSVVKGIGNKELDDGGRIITAEYDKFYVICTYVPNSSRGLVK